MTGHPVRVSVVGCGEMARRVHLPVLGRLRGVVVAGVADTDEERLQGALALAPGATPCASIDELLDAVECDGVVVATPPADHGASGLAALARGKHVYVEKPLASTLTDALSLVDAWRRAGTVGMVGLNYRLNPLHVGAREAVRRGAIGNVRTIRSAFSLAPRPLPPWKLSRCNGGGVLLDLAIHHVDLAMHLLDAVPENVSARLESRRSEDDTAELSMTFPTGVRMESFFSFCDAEQDWMEIQGSAGRLRVDRYRLWRARLGGRGAAALGDVATIARTELARRRAPGGDPSYARALEAFVTAVRGGPRVPVDFADGLRAMEVLHMAESAREAAAPCDRGTGQ